MGLIFAAIFFFNGLVIDSVGKRNLLITILLVCATFGVFIPYTLNSLIVLICLVGFVASGVCGNILSSILVDVFDTKILAMALSVVFSFGRLGAVFGSMMVSLMIKNQCEEIFWVFGGLLVTSAITAVLLVEKNSNETLKKRLFEV